MTGSMPLSAFNQTDMRPFLHFICHTMCRWIPVAAGKILFMEFSAASFAASRRHRNYTE